jgi:hypothetical protein
LAEWTLPPRAKLFEALSAVADGRVRVLTDRHGEGRAEVDSSDRRRTYLVEWSAGATTIAANDNASYWQGYLGYPAVAVLLVLRRLRCGDDIAASLAGIDWHELNRRYRRDYDAALGHVLDVLEQRGVPRAPIERAVDDLMEQLAALELHRGPRRRPPRGRRSAEREEGT